MSKRKGTIKQYLIIIFLSITGCHLLYPYEPTPVVEGEKHYYYKTDIVKCKKENKPLEVVVNKVSSNFQADCYSVSEGLNVNDKVYCDPSNWVVQNIDYPPLKGSNFIKTHYRDNDYEFKNYLELQWKQDIEALYIAYDSRAMKKPDWLQPPYYEQLFHDDHKKTPYTITISKRDMSNPAIFQLIDMEIYKYNEKLLPQANTIFNIDGNFFGMPSWPGNIEPAMFMIIIEPQHEDNCNVEPITVHMHDGCYDSEKSAEEGAKTACEAYSNKNDPGWVCRKPVLEIKDDHCLDVSTIKGGLNIQSKSFVRSSEIEFDPANFKSLANITILDNNYTRNARGTLHFEYLLDDFRQMKEIQMNSIIIEIDPIDTQAGKFSDIVINMLAPVTAKCWEKNPPSVTPCNVYQIPQNLFIASLSAKEDGNTLIFVSKNSIPIYVLIDNVNRTFHLEGTLSLTVKVDGEDTKIDIDIDMLGHFKNFAPNAAGGKESTKWVECGFARDKKSRNRAPIFLNSAGSFEIYGDHIPNNAYKWYEDYSLVTEKFWGQGPKMTIGAYKLSYGVHNFTLVIKDDYGITDTDSFNVEVRDTIPPKLFVPMDIFMLQNKPGPVKLDIGKAWANDICSCDINITNDAPKSLIFHPGVTSVNWEADDGRGHITKGIQKVYVFVLPDRIDSMPIFRHIKEVTDALEKAIGKSKSSLEEYEFFAESNVDFKNLVDAVRYTIRFMKKSLNKDIKNEMSLKIIGGLQAVHSHLTKSQSLMKQSRELGEEKNQYEIHAAVIEHIVKANNIMAEVVETLQGIESEPESLNSYDL